MKQSMIKRYDEDIKRANGDEIALLVILRSKWLYCHRGTNITSNSPEFGKWFPMALAFIGKS